MQYFPLFLNILHQPILVVGGGEVACRKVETLVKAGANVTIVSPTIAPFLHELVKKQQCQWVQNFYSSEFMHSGYMQAWATTDNPELNHQVHKDAKECGVLVNVVDDKPYCDFITPSMINRGRIQLAISSGGASPVLIRHLRESLEAVLPQNLALLADFCESKRQTIKEYLPAVSERRKFWECFLRDRQVEEANNNRQLQSVFERMLVEGFQNGAHRVWIGYGHDVEMLPLKALRYMQQAELILYDERCPLAYLELVRRDAEKSSFQHPGELTRQLDNARERALRVCIFIPQHSHDFSLLVGDDLQL